MREKNLLMNSKKSPIVYHIYAKDKCIAHSIPESEFEGVWETAQHIVGFMQTDYEVSDLNYEKVVQSLIYEEASY